MRSQYSRDVDTVKSFSEAVASNTSSVMPGLVPGIHDFLTKLEASKTWMAGSSPAMTVLVFLSPDRLAPGLARRGGDDTRKIDLILARHADAFEFHRVGIERPGRVESHFCADAVARRRIEFRA